MAYFLQEEMGICQGNKMGYKMSYDQVYKEIIKLHLFSRNWKMVGGGGGNHSCRRSHRFPADKKIFASVSVPQIFINTDINDLSVRAITQAM